MINKQLQELLSHHPDDAAVGVWNGVEMFVPITGAISGPRPPAGPYEIELTWDD